MVSVLLQIGQFDVSIDYFIAHGKYDIFKINEVLFEYDQPLLGGELMDYVHEIDTLIQKVSLAIGNPISRDTYEIVDRGLPHIPPTRLPAGKMAIYMFLHGDEFLKIGKANQRSIARFCSQHYGLNAPSTLAKSLLSDSGMSDPNIDPSNIKDWIKSNCRRIDIIINADLGVFTLELIEGVMHYKYEPKYEGFASQR